MSLPPLDELLHAATLAAEAAAVPIRELYAVGVLPSTKEGDARNLVTAADLAADRAIAALLRERFPTHLLLSEESPAPDGALDPERPTWVIDPLDGTSNFAHGLPLFAVSIALVHGGRSRVGVVHAPLLGWRFAAAEGRGATLNGAPIRVSARESLAESIADSDWPRAPTIRRRMLARFTALGERVHTLRSLGSAALGQAAVAAGWVDLYVNLTLGPWDMAAGELLVREAGGHVTAADGAPWALTEPTIMASNGAIHDEALAVLRAVADAPYPTP